MQFDDPRSILEAAAAKPTREVDPHGLISKGRRLRTARYAAMAAGLAVTVAGASASLGTMTGSDRPAPVGDATESVCDTAPVLRASIFLRDRATEADVAALRARLAATPGVEAVQYVSKKAAYREFKRLYRDQPRLYEAVPASALPATLRVTVADKETLELVAETTSPAIDEVRGGGELDRLCSDTTTDTPDPHVTEPPVEETPEPAAELVLLREECGSALPGLGRARFPNGRGGTWCRFVLRVDNEGDVPIVLDPNRQRLSSKIAVRRPWQVGAEAGSFGAQLFEPIAAGDSKLGQIVYLLREGEAPVALEMALSEVSKPIQFELLVTSCAGSITQGSCFSERDVPLTYVVRGEVLEGTAEVELYHCGVMPIAFDNRSWVADPPPFDDTNAPEGFVGTGRIISELGSLSATYVDESGVSFEVRAVEGWTPPPCG